MSGGDLGFRPLVLISGLAVGGAETVTVRFLRHLDARGHTVPLCTLTDRLDDAPARTLERSGIPRHDLGARRLLDPETLARLIRLLRRNRIDLLHAHGQDASILAAAVTLLHPVRLVVTRHVLEEPTRTLRERGRAGLTAWALRRADLVVAVSQAVAHRLVDSETVPRERIRVIPNGVEIRRFEADRLARSPAEVRDSLSLSPQARVLLVPAVLREGKGHELLLDVLPELHRTVPDIQVLFAGDGEREDALRRKVRELGLQDSVHFLGFRSDIPELLAAADLVVLPSSAEALPTVLVEAAAAGCPVVATRVGGVPEVVEDGRTGVLVPPDDRPALLRALIDLLRNPERARDLGREARLRAQSHFAITSQADRTVDLWREVVARGRGGAR